MVLWVSVRISGRHRFRLSLPIPIFLLLMLGDVMEDYAALLPAFWHGYGKEGHKHEDPATPVKIKNILIGVSGALHELVLHAGPLDLVDADIESEEGHVAVKCLLR